jgi:cell division protein FtsA
VTDDIRRGLGIIANTAEKVKREYGHSYLGSIMKDEVFMIPGVGGRSPLEIAKSYFCGIIQPRMEEIFEFALAEIRRSGYAGSLGAGVVITGGASLLRGTEQLAQEVFGMPVKIGIPSGISYTGLAPEVENPMYATAVGLALYGLRDKKTKNVIEQDTMSDDVVEPEKNTEEKKLKLKDKVKNFLQNF